ncbi:MAG: response regulator [Chlorobiales bacterium]|nr:response regulator [Chlorobiales bacterium]
MSVDGFVKVVEVLTKLLGVLVWPVLLAYFLVRFSFSSELREFFFSLSELSLKGGGLEATAKRKQDEATSALVAASVARPDAVSTPENAAREAKEAADVVSDSVTSRVIRRASQSTVLWVDDLPNNNVYERRALEALGVSFVLATSTDEALEKIKKQKFDVIISDMGRPPDKRAGYTLLEMLHASGNQTPFVIYAGSNASEHKAEARSRGAIGSTNRAVELFNYVINALSQNA